MQRRAIATERSRNCALVAAMLGASCLWSCRAAVVTHVPLKNLQRTLDEVGKAERGHPIPFKVDGEATSVGKGHDPTVVLTTYSGGKEKELEIPAADVDVRADELVLRMPYGVEEIPNRDIRDVKVVLYEVEKPNWKPTWGLGGSVGATGGFGPRGEVLPFWWWAIEVGGFPLASSGTFFTGTRVRPLALGMVYPYVGGFLSTIYGDSDGDASTSGASGARLGVDLQVERRWMVEIEAAAMRVEGSEFAFRKKGWGPWGGVAATYFH